MTLHIPPKLLTQLSPLVLDIRFSLSLSWLLHLDRLINHEVHELIEPPDLALDANAQLLKQPDLDRAALLQELEDEVDGRKQHLARSTTAATRHFCLYVRVEVGFVGVL